VILSLLSACTLQKQDELKEIKVALVDHKKLWQESQQAKEYQTQLNNKVAKLREGYKQERKDLSAQERAAKETELYQRIESLRENLRDEFNEDIFQVVSKIAQNEDYDIVLKKNEVRFGGQDITTEVLTELKNE